MDELILIRHGESEHHTRGFTGGWTDMPLTALGIQQAKRVGAALSASETGGGLVLLSSDLLRARQTAEIIGSRVGIRPSFHHALRELNNGVAKDKSLAEAKCLEAPITEPTVDWVPYTGAESWQTMTGRVVDFMRGVDVDRSKRSVYIVSHGNAMVAIVHWWLGLGREHWSRISYAFDCGSVTRLGENRWGERTILKLNDTSHLLGMMS